MQWSCVAARVTPATPPGKGQQSQPRFSQAGPDPRRPCPPPRHPHRPLPAPRHPLSHSGSKPPAPCRSPSTPPFSSINHWRLATLLSSPPAFPLPDPHRPLREPHHPLSQARSTLPAPCRSPSTPPLPPASPSTPRCSPIHIIRSPTPGPHSLRPAAQPPPSAPGSTTPGSRGPLSHSPSTPPATCSLPRVRAARAPPLPVHAARSPSAPRPRRRRPRELQLPQCPAAAPRLPVLRSFRSGSQPGVRIRARSAHSTGR